MIHEPTVLPSPEPADEGWTGRPNAAERERGRQAAIEFLRAAVPDADPVLQKLADDVRARFGTELCMVNLVLADVQYFRVWSGDLPTDLVEARQDPRERSLCQHVVETERPLVVRDFLVSHRFRDQHFCITYGIRFYAGTPLVTSTGHAIGSLCLLDSQPRAFDAADEELLAAYARVVVGRLEMIGLERLIAEREQAQAAVRESTGRLEAEAARSARLYGEARDRAERLGVIQAIAARLNRINDPASVGQAVAEELYGLIRYDACRVCVLEGDRLLPIALRAEHEEYLGERPDEFVIEVGQGITGWVAQHGEPALLADSGADGRAETIPGTEDIEESMLVVPMKYGGEVTGVISLSKVGLGRFTPLDLQLLCTLADQTATALENARLLERVRAEAEALKESEERYRLVSRATNDAIWDWDLTTDRIAAGGALESVFGYVVEEAGTGIEWWEERIHPDDAERVFESARVAIDGGGDAWAAEYRFRRADGSYAVVVNRGHVVRDGVGRAVRMIGSLADMTERKALEERLEHQAFHDALTGLPNRAFFLERLREAAIGGEPLGVLFLDLDGFKHVNDSLGHAAGDELLQAAAGRLGRCVRDGDVVARLGGDEFTVLLGVDSDLGRASDLARRIIERFGAPFAVAGRKAFVGASVGVALSVAGDDPEDLMRAADIAMYRAKQSGRGRYEVFDPEVGSLVSSRLNREAEIRRAIERGELRVQYQPKVRLGTGLIEAVEALVRWQHPEKGFISPAAFIPLAEETGLILPIGRWVLEEACRQATVWHAAHPSGPLLVISVNLSARQFEHPDLVAEVAGVLKRTGLDPRTLQLEITEGAVMRDASATTHTLRGLKALGVRLAIDDFGTGYSSLSYLKRFPVDMLKVDKSFVDGLGRNPEDTAIVRAVITLAHALEMLVTAEGVETEEQRRLLNDLRCELGQGYLFSAPLSPEAMAAVLEENSRVGEVVVAAPAQPRRAGEAPWELCPGSGVLRSDERARPLRRSGVPLD